MATIVSDPPGVSLHDAIAAMRDNIATTTCSQGQAFTTSIVTSLRTHWKIPGPQPDSVCVDRTPVTVAQAARELSAVASTVHRWINDRFIPAEQTTPGAESVKVK